MYDKDIDMFQLHKLRSEMKFHNIFINGLKMDVINFEIELKNKEYKNAQKNYSNWIETMYSMYQIYPISFSYIKLGFDIFQIEKLKHDLIILNILKNLT
jgi:hypothetical protein